MQPDYQVANASVAALNPSAHKVLRNTYALLGLSMI
ncbi:MAG: BAX inhibitor (BI)-1/YccA family protein, partial [Methylobacterium sp.]|nr:BAX inhibitor (BI)-1/YccA family protein [Methylobacterium sp.]